MKLTVEVTQDDVDKSTVLFSTCLNRSQHCPVALALRRVTGKVWRVGYSSLSISYPQEADVFLPTPAEVFIIARAFDIGFSLSRPPTLTAPIIFTLEVPDNLYTQQKHDINA